MTVALCQFYLWLQCCTVDVLNHCLLYTSFFTSSAMAMVLRSSVFLLGAALVVSARHVYETILRHKNMML